MSDDTISITGRNLHIGDNQQYYLSQVCIDGIKAYIQLMIGISAMEDVAR